MSVAVNNTVIQPSVNANININPHPNANQASSNANVTTTNTNNTNNTNNNPTVSVASAFNNVNSVQKQVIIVKVAIVGDSQIGKTTLMVKYIEDKFDEEFIETLGLNVMEKSFELKNCTANLQIYDLGGQRQFAELMPTALEGTKAVIFAFNLIQKSSLVNIKRWFKDSRKLNKVFKPILVGTKYDLFDQKDLNYRREITKMSRSYAENMKAPLIFCSSKTSTHVKQVFTIVVGSVFNIHIKSKQKHDADNDPLLEYDIISKNNSKNKHKKHKKKHKHKKHKKKHKNKHKIDKNKSSSSDSDSNPDPNDPNDPDIDPNGSNADQDDQKGSD